MVLFGNWFLLLTCFNAMGSVKALNTAVLHQTSEVLCAARDFMPTFEQCMAFICLKRDMKQGLTWWLVFGAELHVFNRLLGLQVRAVIIAGLVHCRKYNDSWCLNRGHLDFFWLVFRHIEISRRGWVKICKWSMNQFRGLFCHALCISHVDYFSCVLTRGGTLMC